MSSYNNFRPGSRKNTSRIIKYIADYNALNGKAKTCYCITDQYNKNVPGSSSPSIKLSNAMRISQIIRNSKGGRFENINYSINYLGRSEGMSGGSGMPPINRFN